MRAEKRIQSYSRPELGTDTIADQITGQSKTRQPSSISIYKNLPPFPCPIPPRTCVFLKLSHLLEPPNCRPSPKLFPSMDNLNPPIAVCNLCEIFFPDLLSVQVHTLSCHGEWEFTCPWCRVACTDGWSLAIHECVWPDNLL